jgi:hypothetical protein
VRAESHAIPQTLAAAGEHRSGEGRPNAAWSCHATNGSTTAAAATTTVSALDAADAGRRPGEQASG